MPVKQVSVCSAGECNGECYACRLRSTEAERAEWERITRMLFDKCVVAGTWGPWSDDWSEEYERRLWVQP